MTAQFELMQKNITDLIAEMKSQVQSEVESASNREREARNESMRQQQRNHLREVKALRGEVQDATAARFRLESVVNSMLEDTAKAAVEEVNGRLAELSATIAEHEKEVDSLWSVAQILEIDTPERLTPNTGKSSSSVSTLGRNELSIIRQTAEKCIDKIVNIAAPNGDADGMCKLLQDSGKLSALLGAPIKDDAELGKLRANIAQAYQVYNDSLAKAFLSLLALTMTIPDLTLLASTHASTSVGDLVAVRSVGHTRTEGVVLSIDDATETCSLQIHVRTEEAKKMRHVTTAQEAALLLASMELTDEIRHNVKLKDVAAVGSVRCTEHEVKAARKHANLHFPGKLSVKQYGDLKRIRKSLAHIKTMIEHFEDVSLFPVRFSSSKGAKRFRALPINQSFIAACDACDKIGCERPRKQDYYRVVGSSDYTKQVPQNCVCTYCRTLGMETFDELDGLLEMISLPENIKKGYLDRSFRLREFLCVYYARQLKEQDSDPHFCIRFALTCANVTEFMECCSHDRGNGESVRPPELTMDDLANKTTAEGGRGQNATTDCWDSECCRCAKRGVQSVMCNNCAVVMCKDCVQRTRDDMAGSISKSPMPPEDDRVNPSQCKCTHSSDRCGKKKQKTTGGVCDCARGGSRGRREKPAPMCPTGHV